MHDCFQLRFLLAHLQILHVCCQLSVTQVRKSMDSLPTQVFDFYGEALKRIESQSENDSKTVKRALSYISCARRPLSVEELRHALSIEIGDTKLDTDNFPVIDILLNISAGLIRVDENNSTIVLVHYTLQEYLEKYKNILLAEPEMEFAAACLTYLSFDIFSDGPCSNEESLERRLQEYSFLDYASHYWGHHVMGFQLHELTDMMMVFLRNEMKVSSSVQILNIPRHRMKDWYARFPKKFSPLHVVAFWGLDKILTILLQETVEIDSQDSHRATALQLAAQNGHIDVVLLLMEEDAETNMRNNRGETALYWAARNGHEIIVKQLIMKRANIITKDDEGWAALDWAVIGAYNGAVEVLLWYYPATGSDNRGKNKALTLAAEAGNGESCKCSWRVEPKSTGRIRKGAPHWIGQCPKGERKLYNCF